MALYRDEVGKLGDLIAAAAEGVGVPPQAIEKDYWITQALRGMQAGFPHAFIFKGGTSLSKGYHLIQRFSEDMDILVLDDGLSKTGRTTRVKSICAAAAEMTESRSELLAGGGEHRTVALYREDLTEMDPLLPFIRLDVGFSGGIEPHGERTLSTLIGEELEQRGVTSQREWDDLAPFGISILHPARTLVEKLLLVNTVVVRVGNDRDALRKERVSRHFYDIHCLLGDNDVVETIRDRPAFERILDDAVRITRDLFGTAVELPEGGLGGTPTFEPDGDLYVALSAEYGDVMDALYFGRDPYPPFDEVVSRVAAHADLL